MRTGRRNPVVRINATMKELFSEITDKHLGAVSVVDDAGKLVGLVTDYDIRIAVGEGSNVFAKTIQEIMNPRPISIPADEKAITALRLMEEREKPLAVLPVIEGDRVICGMIHLHDLIDKGL
jgi:arabinose-5-phosphate isomerase